VKYSYKALRNAKKPEKNVIANGNKKTIQYEMEIKAK
jgi:hypothetical protein